MKYRLRKFSRTLEEYSIGLRPADRRQKQATAKADPLRG
jgi:hypothetical protein